MTEQLHVLWECEVCGSQNVVEDRGSYRKKLEVHPRLNELSKEELQKIRDCRHPRRKGPSGLYFCSGCERGPLREPHEVDGGILCGCCANIAQRR